VRPDEALCDGKQAIDPTQFAQLVRELAAIDDAVRAPLDAPHPDPSPSPQPEPVA